MANSQGKQNQLVIFRIIARNIDHDLASGTSAYAIHRHFLNVAGNQGLNDLGISSEAMPQFCLTVLKSSC